MTIKLAAVPALATAGKWMLCSVATGNMLNVDGVIGSDSRIRYFDSPELAVAHVPAMNSPQALRQFAI